MHAKGAHRRTTRPQHIRVGAGKCVEDKRRSHRRNVHHVGPVDFRLAAVRHAPHRHDLFGAIWFGGVAAADADDAVGRWWWW